MPRHTGETRTMIEDIAGQSRPGKTRCAQEVVKRLRAITPVVIPDAGQLGNPESQSQRARN